MNSIKKFLSLKVGNDIYAKKKKMMYTPELHSY